MIGKDTRENLSRIRNYSNNILKIIVMIVLLFVFQGKFTEANATSVGYLSTVNVAVDYVEGVATVVAGPGNSTKFYMSTDNLKSWEPLEVYRNSTGILCASVDITPYLKNKESIINFKGNRDTSQRPVPLQGEDNNISATYQVANGMGRIAINNNTSNLVEYRNGQNGQWKTLNGYSLETRNYEYKGASIQMRTVASVSKRAGKIITVRVPKKPTAPSIKLDGSKFAFTGLKSGLIEYRVGDDTEWTTYSSSNAKTNTLDLATLFKVSTVQNTQLPAGIVEFRTKATTKQIASSIKYFDVPIQPIYPSTITINGTTLTIFDCSSKKQYEYSIVETGDINLSTARWTSVSSPRPVIIPRLSPGFRVYVRAKSYIDPTTKMVVPASTYKIIVIETITIKF